MSSHHKQRSSRGGVGGASPSLRQVETQPFTMRGVSVLLTDIGSNHGSSTAQPSPKKRGRPRKSESGGSLEHNRSPARPPSLRSPLRSEVKVMTSGAAGQADLVKVTVVTDSEDSAVEIIEMSEGKETKVEYLDEKAKCYKKDKSSRRPKASVSVVPRNQFSLNDLRRGKVTEVVRQTTQNKLKFSSEPKITECVVKLVKNEMVKAMCSKEKSEDVVKDRLDTSDEKEVTFKESAASDKPAQPSDIQRSTSESSSDTIVMNSSNTSVDTVVMLKYIDSSGQDITGAVKEKSQSPERKKKIGGLKLVDYEDSLDTSGSEAAKEDSNDLKVIEKEISDGSLISCRGKKLLKKGSRRSKRNSVSVVDKKDVELNKESVPCDSNVVVDKTEGQVKFGQSPVEKLEEAAENKTGSADLINKDNADQLNRNIVDPASDENMTGEEREVIEPVAVAENQRLAEVNSSIELQMKEDFGIASEEDDVTDVETALEDDSTNRPDPIRESPSFFSKTDAEHETVCEPKSSPITCQLVTVVNSDAKDVELNEEPEIANSEIEVASTDKKETNEEFETGGFCILEKVSDDKVSVAKPCDESTECFVVGVEDDSSLASNAEISDQQTIVDDHDYGFKSPGREFVGPASDILSRVGGGPRVEVESSPCLPVEDVLNRFAGEKFEESEVESDCIERASNVLQEFSADDEHDESGDEFVASSAWSSLSFILETQEQSPAKTKLKKRVRKKSSSKSRSGSEKCTSSTKKKSVSPPNSSRKYRRSSRMSNLLDTGTDTDDQSPARPRHVPAKLEFKDCDQDKPVIIPPATRKSLNTALTTSAEFTKESSLTIEDSFLDQSNDIPNSPAIKSVEISKTEVSLVPQTQPAKTKSKRNVVEIFSQAKSPGRAGGVKDLVVGASTMSNTDTENEYTRPRLLVIPTTGTDTETDTDRMGLEKNLMIKDLARLKGSGNVRRSLDVFSRTKPKVSQGRHSTGGGGDERNWEPDGDCPYSLAEIVWARVGTHPWWPAMVTNDEEGLKCERIKPTRLGQRPLWEIHVSFFGENTRAWVDENHLKSFNGAESFEKEKKEVLGDISNKKTYKQKEKLLKAFTPTNQLKDRWLASVQGAESVMSVPEHRRMTKMGAINRDLCESIKRKRKLSGDSESSIRSMEQMPASKRARVEEDVGEVVRGLKTEDLLEMGKNISGYKLYMLGQKEQLLRAGFSEDLLEEECLEKWEELSQVEKKAYNEQKKSILEKLDDDGGARRGAASQRQLEVKARQEEKERKEKEKGPGWYYVLEPVKPKKVEEPEVLIGNFLSSRCCVVCEEAAGEQQVLKCRGTCGAHYHPACLNMDSSMGTEDGSFKCTQCQLNRHKCFLCKKFGDEGKVKIEAGSAPVPALPDLGVTRKCSMSGCGKWYHQACLTSSPLWPQARVGSALACPDHTCHTCASDNTRDPVMKYTEKLMHCVRCPTAYHCGDYCVAAGTIQITKTDIICPKHYKPPAKNKKGSTNVHVNASWCFVCSKGGSLICCEVCPSSFHTECLNITSPPEGKFYCDDCISGRMPLYNDLAWIKLGNYRWWPARVLHPSNVPDNIEKLKHQDGEFPIQFLGSGDYYWINHGRAFLYEEGDSERVPTLSSSKTMDASFKRGLIEAEQLFNELKGCKEVREKENSSKVAKYGGPSKPTPYVKLKSNKPYGSCPVYTIDPGEIQPCDCDRNKDNPCGEDSSCLNRMLMFECHPQVCTARELCRNMRFQKRQYPPIQVVRSEGRGWGLRNQGGIKKGQFVIEYVGELITMQEYRSRMAANQLSGEENYYYLTIDSNRMIDAGPKGNLARFMNHSCDPNCITQKWTVNGDTRVGLFALKDIPDGSELTFNYQFETVGETKKKCMCGADNCSGLIGEKPQNKEKEEKKMVKKKKSKAAPVKLRYAKVWEDACYRCSERGTLLQCGLGLCPKVYHPLCVGKEAMPRGKWHCPWHYCVDCGTLVTQSGVWCRHCPNAYCKTHKEKVVMHEVLGALCGDHEEEVEFLLDCLRASSHGLAEIIPCPSPTAEQLGVWRRARGVEPVTDTHSESEASNADSKESKPRRSRFSVDPESRESSVGVSRSGSGAVTRGQSPEPVMEQAHRAEEQEEVVTIEEEPEIKVEQLDDTDTVVLDDSEEIPEARAATPELTGLPALSSSSPLRPVDLGMDQTVEEKRQKLASLQERLAKLKTTTPTSNQEEQAPSPLLSPRRSQRDLPSQELTRIIGNQSVVCNVENCNDTRQFDLADYGKHFSTMHRTLSLDKLLVTNERKAQYTVLDIYKFVYRCGFEKCSMLFFGINENSKSDFVKKIKSHWSKPVKGQKSHREITNRECVFDNIVEFYAFVNKHGDENLVQNEIEIKEEPRKAGEVRKSKTPEWKVRKSKTPAKKVLEEWEVFDFRKDEQIFSKCYQNDCSFIGTDDVQKMQKHLRFHTLTSFEIESFAADEVVMGERLKKAVRVLYKNINNETVGVGPQVYLDTKEVVSGAEKYLCQAVSECSMSFLTEKTLLDHCKQVHPPLKPNIKALTPQKLEFGGQGYKCQECQAMITCVPGSPQFSSHWVSHSSTISTMRFLNMETSQVMVLGDIYPYSAQCKARDCFQFFSSQISFEDVERDIVSHWSSSHTGEVLYTTTSYKTRNSPRKQAKKTLPLTDLDPLELEGPFRCEQCGSELHNANAVFQHSSAHHKDQPLTSLNIRHLVSNRVFLNTALYRFVLQCGVHGCNKFAGRNSSMDGAIKKLKSHWLKDHPDNIITDFCYLDIGVEHDDGAQHDSRDTDDVMEETEIKSEPVIKLEAGASPVGYIPLQLCEVEGPFSCTHALCDFTCNSPTMFGKHWNLKHSDKAASASFIDQTTSATVTLYQVYTYIVQCVLCGTVRCARDVLNKAVDGVSQHLRNCHTAEIGGQVLSSLYQVLQDLNGRQLEPVSDPIGVFSDNYNLQSYRLLVKQGLIHNHREMVQYKGPFRCHICGEETFQKLILAHWVKHHPGIFTQFRMVDVSTQKLLGSHDLFKCLALCPASDCYNVVGQNSSYDILKYNLRNHYQKKHGQPAENFDFMVIVPPENFPQPPRVHQTMLENVVAKVEDPDNPPVDDDYDTDRVPTVAEFTPERSNTSFSQKGYYGPYYCLREGCGFMCDKFGLTTQKLLVNHWSMEHGDVRTLLYLDISSFTILNVKVICNNVGYCSYAGCDHIMYGSRKADFPTSVANHWKNTHPSPGNSYNPNMCKVISGKQVPTIREEEAVDMVQKLNLKGVGRLTTHSTYDLEEGRTPARSSTRISPRKLEQGARNYFEEDYEDSMMEDNEDAIDHEGPYQCCECSYTVSLSIASNRAVLNHWVLEHGSPDKLRFVDQPTGEVLTATTFFTTVGKCVRCDYVLGNNRYEADMYRRIGIHWEREHSQEPECSDQQKLEIIDLDDGESVCSEDSDLVDPDMIYNGPFECVVDNCGEQVDHTKTGWKMKCMNHFLQEHDHVINQLRIRDIQSGRVLKIQHLFQYVGQCHQEDCHMIKGINARNKKDGNFELRRTFQNHYKSEHPQVEKVDFTVLVDNHEVKFVTENGKKKTSERSVQSTEVSNNIIYRCNFCDKEFPRQDSLSHWNTKHLNTSITMLTYTDTVTNSNVKLKHLMRTVGQCSTCQHYLGSSSTPGLVSAIRSHYSSSHSRNIIPNTPEHYLTMQPPLPPTPHNYGAEGFICKLCDHRTSYKYLFKHWNSVHKADISLMKMLCVKSNTTGGIFTIFPHVGRCTLCQAYYGATTKHHPLKRVAKEHFRALHGSEDEFDESVHMVAVLMEEGSDVVGDGVDVRMSMESVSQGETDGEDVCLLTCSIPGCGEANITSYSNHFSRKHKELPLEMIRVTTDGGKLLTCQDLFNFALKCDLCTFVSVTGHTTIKHARKSVRKHWVRDHQDMDVDDMTFTDIMPADPVQKRENLSAHSPMKKQKMVDNSPLPSSSRYRCVECDKVLVLGGSGGVSLLKHWTEQHPLLPPVTFRVRSVSDGLVVGLRSLYQYIYRCGAPGCQQVSVSYQGERNAVSKVKEHWMRQHNRACEARYSPVTHLGYLCTVHGCTTVLDMQEDLPQHHTTHQEVLPRDMAVRDLETQQVLMVGDIFSWVSECPADCGAIFFSNTDEDSVTRAGEEHWDQEHGDMPRVGGESARGGYQCMAGADDGEVGCSTVIPEGNNGNALRHWQYKHSCLPLRDLVFMNQSSGAFLQISDVFSRVLVCTHQNCGLVTYTNYLNRGGRVMATHWEKDHGSMEEQGDIFDNMDTLTFLASNHNITHEEFVDFEHEEDFANVANDNLDDDVVIDDTSGVDDPEVTFEELQVVGYKCVVPDCQKVVAVSRFSTAMVALNRLKSHFSKMHRDLPSDEFKYETRYNHDLVNAVSVVVEDIPAPAPPPPPPPAPEYPSIVYKCPGLLKGAKPCPEKMMDANALRIHWGSQHNVDGQTFSPQQISIHDTSHYMCSAQGCEYRILTIGPLRTHWDREHQDHPNRFQVVYNEVKMIKPVVPVPVEVVSEQPKQEAVAEAEEADEAPMIPVGRKTKVPPLPSGCSLQCGVSGCSYQTESSRDMELHSRLCGQPWYVCQTRGCGHRVLGISAIKEHMEVVHTSVKVEDWDYKEVSSRKRSRSSSSGSPGPVAGPSHSGQASPKKAKVECDVSANFDLTGLDGDTTGDSDSDFDLDYTVV